MTASNQQAAFPTFTYEEEESPALNDISTILLGAQAFTGKVLHGAGQAVRAPDETTEAKARAENAERREAERTLSNIQMQAQRAMEWDNQGIMVGGVRMTRAEAQKAREKILSDPEKYANWAREHGLIKAGQEQAFIDTVRRQKVLANRERELVLKGENRTPLENEELQQTRAEQTKINQSPLGIAANKTTAYTADPNRRADYGIENNTKNNENTNTSPENTPAEGTKTESPAARLSAASVEGGISSGFTLGLGSAFNLAAQNPPEGGLFFPHRITRNPFNCPQALHQGKAVLRRR